MRGYAFQTITAGVLIIVGLIVSFVCRWGRDDSVQTPDQEPISDDIQHAIQQLLDATPAGAKGGFVIFDGYRDIDYVQFSLDPNGLLLACLEVPGDDTERMPRFREHLERRGFQEVSHIADGPPVREQIVNLQTGQFMVFDDGLFAQTGRNAQQNRDLTVELLRNVFSVTDLKRIEITLEPDG